jgi:hypothetical protein
MISDERCLDDWNVGPDNTGNLMDVYKILHTAKEAAEMGDISR